MKYILKEDYDNDNFNNLIEAENTKDLEVALGTIKGYGIEICSDDRADGIVYVQR